MELPSRAAPTNKETATAVISCRRVPFGELLSLAAYLASPTGSAGLGPLATLGSLIEFFPVFTICEVA